MSDFDDAEHGATLPGGREYQPPTAPLDAAQRMVLAFHDKMPCGVGSGEPEIRNAELRASLIAEESAETVAGLVGRARALEILGAAMDRIARMEPAGPSLVETADGICDSIVVHLGTAVECAIDVSPLFNEVMRSNMEKAGGPRREDGKILKPPGWKPPRIAELLEYQAQRARELGPGSRRGGLP